MFSFAKRSCLLPGQVPRDVTLSSTSVVADVNGCVSSPCSGAAGLNSNGTCVDVPAPGTGFACLCNAGYWWDGTACQLEPCVRVLGGAGAMGYTGDFGPAYQASLTTPYSVSVDSKGDTYIAGETRPSLGCALTWQLLC
jgi:hypothetical protein